MSSSRRRPSKLDSSRRRSPSCSSVMFRSLRLAMPGAVGLERRRRAGRGSRPCPESDQGRCCVGAARPTNGGTDGSTGPCSLATAGAEARPAAHRGQRLRAASRTCTGRRRARRVAPTTERMTANLSMRAAICGKDSPIWMPGTLVAMGLNSPRISAGASGLDLPHVLVGRAAAQEDVDDRLVPRGRGAGAGLRPGRRRLESGSRPPRRGRRCAGSPVGRRHHKNDCRGQGW